MKNEFEESEQTCWDCNFFFPDTVQEATEYGICLFDDAFEPYLDELLEHQNYDSCRELIKEKKFIGDTPACEHFEKMEEFEIDDNSHLGKELTKLKNTGKLDADAIKLALLMDQIDKIDWKTVPIDNHVAQLKSHNKKKQLQAISTLASLASSGNEAAFDQIINHFKQLPVPTTLDETHFKIEIFRHLEYQKEKAAIVPHLIHELYQIQSNNSTRQWISKIKKFKKYLDK